MLSDPALYLASSKSLQEYTTAVRFDSHFGITEQEQTDMPHAILRVTHMTGITVREFYISGPEDLQRRVLSMFSGLGLQPQTNTGGEVKFEGEFESEECVCVPEWPECMWKLPVCVLLWIYKCAAAAAGMVGTHRSQGGSIINFSLLLLFSPSLHTSPLQISEEASKFTPSSTG